MTVTTGKTCLPCCCAWMPVPWLLTWRPGRCRARRARLAGWPRGGTAGSGRSGCAAGAPRGCGRGGRGAGPAAGRASCCRLGARRAARTASRSSAPRRGPGGTRVAACTPAARPAARIATTAADATAETMLALGCIDDPRDAVSQDEQPASPGRLPPVGPRFRQRDRPVGTARADEHCGTGPPLSEQDLQPLTRQRMERMGDDNETQRITGRCGTMPPPWRCRAAGTARLVSVCTPSEMDSPGRHRCGPGRAGSQGLSSSPARRSPTSPCPPPGWPSG